MDIQKIGTLDPLLIAMACVEISKNADLFGQIDVREKFPNSPHVHTQSIYLRMPPMLYQHMLNGLAYTDIESEQSLLQDLADSFLNDVDAEDTPSYDAFPVCRALVMQTMQIVGGVRLGRVMIVRLKAGEKIKPHADEGDVPEYYDRFHLVLEGAHDCIHIFGDDGKAFERGVIYWVNQRATHYVENGMTTDRYSLIMDIRRR